MSNAREEYEKNLSEIRQARDQAELLRDQLAAEYERLCQEDSSLIGQEDDDERRQQGREMMRKAIAAADLALSSIDQALREMAQVIDDPNLPDD